MAGFLKPVLLHKRGVWNRGVEKTNTYTNTHLSLYLTSFIWENSRTMGYPTPRKQGHKTTCNMQTKKRSRLGVTVARCIPAFAFTSPKEGPPEKYHSLLLARKGVHQQDFLKGPKTNCFKRASSKSGGICLTCLLAHMVFYEGP